MARGLNGGMRRTPLVAWTVLASSLFIGSTVPGAAQAPADPVLALLTAARKGDVAGIRRALGDGADVNATDPSFSQTALMRAAMFDQPAAVDALLAARARADARSYQERTALHWAAVAGSANVIRRLAGAGAQVDAADVDGETPLGLAIRAGSVAAAEALLAAGARVDRMRTTGGRTALDEVRERLADETNPAIKHNLELMVNVLTGGTR